jgi:hypothetical protein
MPPDDPKYFKKIKLGKSYLNFEKSKQIKDSSVIIYILCAINDCIL